MNAILIVLISILILVVVYLVKKTGAQTRLELFTPIAKKYNAEYQPEEILQGDHLFVPYRHPKAPPTIHNTPRTPDTRQVQGPPPCAPQKKKPPRRPPTPAPWAGCAS
ncbi:MAG: hypothetical protein IPG80_12975 [Anaerolineales bacterium]|uniref:hypothetical protein n=1 Tax=Candidatus Villigracilis vicinus TaxID=3140679 RepID=UPI003134C2F5|nr:hypothetical protein [Anaerolineales bacterium]